MDKLETLEGVLSGAALAAAAGFAREGDETQRKLRIVRDDASKALRELEDLNSRGDVIRSRMPAVMDFMAGLSIAHQPSPAPSVTPSLAGLSRPARKILRRFTLPGSAIDLADRRKRFTLRAPCSGGR